jgi:hypothetical protein
VSLTLPVLGDGVRENEQMTCSICGQAGHNARRNHMPVQTGTRLALGVRSPIVARGTSGVLRGAVNLF